MKIGIITFQETNNDGTILQNLALQKAIEKYGHTAETIDYRSEYIAKPYRLSHLRNKGLGKYLFGVIGYLCYLPRSGANKKFRKHVYYSVPVRKGNLNALNQRYDCFITGSDQVWNVNLTGYDDTYFLKFVEASEKKNSYAASVGISRLTDGQKEWYADKLKDFHTISVREASSIALLKDFLPNQITDVLDPVFLLSKEEWKKYVYLPKEKKDYILVYQLGVSSKLVDYAAQCAKQFGCKLIFFPFPLVGLAKGKYKVCAGSGDLVSYLYGAKYVITDSFHGTALSIIFNKKCNSCINVCPVHAVEEIQDEMGFSYPQINEEKCIHCGKCVRVCQIGQVEIQESFIQEYYAGQNKGEKILKESSSGGIFNALAEEILARNGSVYGARFDSEWKVVHGRTVNISETGISIMPFSRTVIISCAGMGNRLGLGATKALVEVDG